MFRRLPAILAIFTVAAACSADDGMHWRFTEESLDGIVGKPRRVEASPSKFVYDPLTGRSTENRHALEIGAGDSVSVPINGNLDSFTIEGFVKAGDPKGRTKPGRSAPVLRLESKKATAEIHIFQSYPPHSYPWWQGQVQPNDGKPQTLSRNVYQGMTHVNDRDWKHVALVYEGKTHTVTFFVDYTALQSQTVPMSLERPILRIAGERDGIAFAGLIDEVRLTPRALQAHEFLRAAEAPLENVRFDSRDDWLPRDAGYVDLRLRYGAVGDGKTDDTAAFQRAFRELASRVPLEFNTLFIPNGTYLVSDSIQWSRFLIVQGESRDGVVIRLKDRCDGFTNPTQPKPVVIASNWGGSGGSGSAIASYLFSATIDTGKGNPGAIGLDFHANNVGAVEEVTIRSGDGSGVAGLSMLRPWPGPALIKNVRIEGFDYGVHLTHREYSMTLEHITLERQNKAGIHNTSNILAVRKLTSRNRVPAVIATGAEAMVTLLDSSLTGDGGSAIQLDGKASLFARNVTTEGYARAVRDHERDVAGGSIEEYVSGPVQSLFDSPKRSLNLPIEETPTLPWAERTKWVNVQSFADRRGADGDWTPALQTAIDSGATHLYFPANTGYTLRETLRLRGKVRHLVGMMTGLRPHESLKGKPVLRVETASNEVILIERLEVSGLEHASPATLVVRHGSVSPITTTAGCGKLFLENIVGSDYAFEHPQHVWARQWNVEKHGAGPCITSNGATIWALGFKTEYESEKLSARGGAKTEILGAFIYPIGKIPNDRPIFTSRDSALSLVYGTSIYQSGHGVHLREERQGVVKELPGSDVKFFGSRQKMHLFTGYPE